MPHERVFHPDLDADFHGSFEGAIDGGFEDEQVADVDGRNEVDVFHGGGDDVGAGVAIGGHGADEVNEVHEAAAEQVAQSIGVVGQDELGHFRLRVGHGARGEARGRSGPLRSPCSLAYRVEGQGTE